MKELAKQELKLLEAKYPNQFQYLKLQLKEFIHLLDEEEEDEQLFKQKQQKQQFYQSIITQESSSGRKRQREEKMDDGYRKPEPEAKPKPKPRIRRRKEGICDAIHKAEACLHKIQTLKSFLCSSNQ
ncbi:hypothetical protein M8C21_003001 [Ambrosia artemisiifolia]|uniref:Uncharacterized protein n=1 Tax=Ambrosia artemisiifolia TaxID=4212 RepID=A0AAD5C3L6_AMBAR|nr:hypothetical protein M8C21_003001 [Ambrosia artemisiifolia]